MTFKTIFIGCNKCLIFKYLALLSLLFPVNAAAQTNWWDRPSVRNPFIDGIQSMVDSMRNNPPSSDPFTYNRYYGYPGTNPFSYDDPWLDELPVFNEDAVPFMQLPTSVRIRGRWLGQLGDGLWIKSSWIRFYSGDEHRDGRFRMRGNRLYVQFPGTRIRLFRFALKDDLLLMRDSYGRHYLYQRYNGDKQDDSKDDEQP